MLSWAAASTSLGSAAIFGPYLAGIAALGAVLVSLLNRKDKRKADSISLADTQITTAMTQLGAQYDRMVGERDYWQKRATEAETRADNAEALSAQVKADLDRAERQLRTARRRKHD